MISAVVHTFNEEENIERCLSSLGFVDEVIVVDMGSTDKTCSKARNFKAKIFQHPFTGFVEPARNFGLSKATGEWIIVVDADEEIPKDLANYLLLASQKQSNDFYRIARKNIIFDKWIKHAGWWPDYQIRFFKKGAVLWTDKIHRVPLTRGSGIDIEALERLSIIHYNYQTLEQYLERLNRYTTISAKELFVSDKDFNISLLFEKPAKEFINRYLVWEGYKDGIHGLALALLQSVSELIVYLKLWQLMNFREERVSLRKIKKLSALVEKQKQHWFVQELLKKPHDFAEGIIWKLKRKFGCYG